MRKAILAALLVLALAALTVGIASANAGPHGGYDQTTAACAGCHRAHTATGSQLLLKDDITSLCKACHQNASGAFTQPWEGYLRGSGARLNGGGFDHLGNTADATTSRHDVGAPGTAWGGKDGAEGIVGELDCTSCHNPHGSTNYRILRDSHNSTDPNQWNGNTDARLWEDSQVQASNDQPTGYDRYTLTTAAYTQGMNRFCTSCHVNYLTDSGSGHTLSTDYQVVNGASSQRYRHAVNVVVPSGSTTVPNRYNLRLATEGNDPAATKDGLVCTTCHFAHGTTATMSGYAATGTSFFVDGVPGQTGVAPSNDSALLYFPNRGVCASCHQTEK